MLVATVPEASVGETLVGFGVTLAPPGAEELDEGTGAAEAVG